MMTKKISPCRKAVVGSVRRAMRGVKSSAFSDIKRQMKSINRTIKDLIKGEV